MSSNGVVVSGSVSPVAVSGNRVPHPSATLAFRSCLYGADSSFFGMGRDSAPARKPERRSYRPRFRFLGHRFAASGSAPTAQIDSDPQQQRHRKKPASSPLCFAITSAVAPVPWKSSGPVPRPILYGRHQCRAADAVIMVVRLNVLKSGTGRGGGRGQRELWQSRP